MGRARSASLVAKACLLLILCAVTGCGGTEGQLLRGWEFQPGSARARAIDAPVHLALADAVTDYRLATEVVLDPKLGSEVDLVLPSLPARVELRAAGVSVPLATLDDGEGAYRHVGPHRFRIPPAAVRDGRLALELTVHHTWTQSAWLDVAPRLVPSGATTPLLQRNRVLNDRGGWFGLVGLGQMGLLFLAVFFWERKRRAYLWFAIQAITASYYPAYVLGITTWLGAKAENLLLAQSLSIAPIVSVYFTHDFFERGRPSRLWLVLLGVAFVVPIPAILPAFVVTSYGAPGVVVCVAAAIAYQIRTGLKLATGYADRRLGVFFLCCWLALGGSAWVDLFAWLGGGEILDGARPACIGLGLFGIFQSMLLSRSHSRSLVEADRLNAKLTGQVRDLEEREGEILALNEELRQQVGRRSAHILAALAGADAAGTSTNLEPGDVVEGRYRVIGAIGSGGMGTVYEVERIHDGRRLALKVTLETRGLALARLAREAQIATRVQHPNVVAVVDTDVASGGYVYLVMELVEGCSLAEFDGRHDVRWSLRVLQQILDGVTALHAHGIVHRDLKPANVLLSGDLENEPHVKITDFGIARGPAEGDDPSEPSEPRKQRPVEPETIRVSPRHARTADATDSDVLAVREHAAHAPASSTPQLTRTGTISGTPSYMAPELAHRNPAITPAVDVFSFGVVAFRLLTGAPPHAEAPLLARLDGREAKAHAPIQVPRLSLRLSRLLDACLAFSPEKRPRTEELRQAFAAALEDTNEDLVRERLP